MQDLGKRMEHRLKLLDSADKDLRDDEFQNRLKIEDLDQRINNELLVIKNEITSLSKECDHLTKAMFALGKLLREKVTTREFKEFHDKVDDWRLDDFITTKELQPSFDRYAKKH